MSWYYIEGILIQCGYVLMVVLGLSLLTGFTGLFSFGHAGFMAIGAYVAAISTAKWGLPFSPPCFWAASRQDLWERAWAL